MRTATPLMMISLFAAGCGLPDENVCAVASQHVASCVPGRQAVENPTCNATSEEMANQLLGMGCDEVRALASSGKADFGWCWTFWDCDDSGDPEGDSSVPHGSDFLGFRFDDSDGVIRGGCFAHTSHYQLPPDGKWIGHKAVLRRGARMNVSVWAEAYTQDPAEVTVEVYLWHGSGWGEPLVAATGMNSVPYHNFDTSTEGFPAVDQWTVPEDGRYFVTYSAQNCIHLSIQFATVEPYYEAAACDDEPGICRSIDPDASCGWMTKVVYGVDSGMMTPNPYCSYGMGGNGWVTVE